MMVCRVRKVKIPAIREKADDETGVAKHTPDVDRVLLEPGLELVDRAADKHRLGNREQVAHDHGQKTPEQGLLVSRKERK